MSVRGVFFEGSIIKSSSSSSSKTIGVSLLPLSLELAMVIVTGCESLCCTKNVLSFAGLFVFFVVAGFCGFLFRGKGFTVVVLELSLRSLL